MSVVDQAEITEVFNRVSGWPEESRRLLMVMIESRLRGTCVRLASPERDDRRYGRLAQEGRPAADR